MKTKLTLTIVVRDGRAEVKGIIRGNNSDIPFVLDSLDEYSKQISADFFADNPEISPATATKKEPTNG